MSTGPLIPASRAMVAARWLMHQLGVELAPEQVVGSIRRGARAVGDVDLLLPLPAEGQPDELYRQMAARIEPRDGRPALFAGATTRTQPLAREVLGMSAGFKLCRLELRLTREPVAVIRVDLHRYTPGPDGNRGWKQLIHTGPEAFARKAVSRWAAISGESADGGFPVRDGRPVPVPSEAEAFRLLDWKYIPPENRR